MTYAACSLGCHCGRWRLCRRVAPGIRSTSDQLPRSWLTWLEPRVTRDLRRAGLAAVSPYCGSGPSGCHLDPVGQEFFARPLAEGAIRGRVRPSPDRPGGLAWKVHRDHWPPLCTSSWRPGPIRPVAPTRRSASARITSGLTLR